jgi:DDE family transposase
VTAPSPDSLLAHLAKIPDPRSPHGRRFALLSLLASACAAVLCGQVSYTAIAQWARNQPPEFLRALGFFRRPPTDGAFRYLFNRLDLGAFEAALSAWIAGLVPADPEQLRPTPLDGKTLTGSDDKLRGAVHLLSLLDGPTGGVLKQQAVGPKTNEHKAAFALLQGMVLQGRIVTADAMFCHRDFAQEVRDRGGHYFFEVKDNQEQLKRDIASAFEPAFSPLRSAAPAGGRRHGPDHRALRRAGRNPDAANDDAAERLPGLAGRGAGVPAGTSREA